MGRKSDQKSSYSGSFRAEGRSKYANSLHLFVSPPSSNHSISPQSRPRVLSCDTQSDYIKPQQQSQHLLSPDVCRIKASSLPSILDVEGDTTVAIVNEKGAACVEDIKTPTSTASSGKYTVKLKGWKIPKFIRKLSDHKPEVEVDVFTVSPTEDGYQQVSSQLPRLHVYLTFHGSFTLSVIYNYERHNVIDIITFQQDVKIMAVGEVKYSSKTVSVLKTSNFLIRSRDACLAKFLWVFQFPTKYIQWNV